MAYVSYLLLISLNFFILLVTTSTLPTSSSSSIAYRQIKFWSENVDNNMPKCILSKLSPLSELETEAFTPIVSKQSFSSNSEFCTTANLVCSAAIKPIPDSNFVYIGQNLPKRPDSSFEKADPSSYFRLSALQIGRKITLPNLSSNLPNRAFLPPQMAKNIPLINSELRRIFPTAFSIPMTKAEMDKSLDHCEAPIMKGERRSCLKTLEDMVEFSRESLGRRHVTAMASDETSKGMGSQVVQIESVKAYMTDKIVVCHEMFFPFAAYYCHLLPKTQIYVVDVVNPKERGTMMTKSNKVVAICHMDTSAWSPDHIAFKLLKSSPGKGEACHWVTQMDLVWIGYD